ncbi:TPA: DUF5050 domain-containing protein [Clostridium botulinum]|nr:DUF5050 domain-containing protein [Clostridium botulinum]
MKKIKGSLLLIMFLLLFNFRTVHALGTNSSNTVTKDKIWTIKFNKFIKLDENTLSNITVKDSENNVVPTTLQLGKNGKSILVLPPKEGYIEGKNYTLTINKSLKDVKGRLLKEGTNLNFIIKSTSTIDTTKLGNTIGNSINNPWVAEDEKYLYFLCSEYMDASAIYKVDKKTSKSYKLSDEEELHNLNVLNNKIYYLKTEENPDYNSENNDETDEYIHNLYVMNTDGKNNKKLITDTANYIVTENYIYYTNVTDTAKLYRCDLTGGNKTKISNEPVGLFNICGDKIIYNTFHDMYENFLSVAIYGNIHIMNLDGSNNKILTNNEAFSFISEKDGIYYINKSDNNKIYKVTLDGKNQKISNVSAESINISSNGTIYYRNLSDTTNITVGPEHQTIKVPTLYKINKDGSSNTKLSSRYCLNINILKDKLYYEEYYDDGRMSGSLKILYKDGSDKDPILWDYIRNSKLP